MKKIILLLVMLLFIVGCSHSFSLLNYQGDLYYPDIETKKGGKFEDPDKSRGKSGWGAWGGTKEK